MLSLLTKEKVEKKFIIAFLYGNQCTMLMKIDISTSPITSKIMKELSWNEGIGRIITAAFMDEPVAVSIILNNLNKVFCLRLTYLGRCH